MLTSQSDASRKSSRAYLIVAVVLTTAFSLLGVLGLYIWYQHAQGMAQYAARCKREGSDYTIDGYNKSFRFGVEIQCKRMDPQTGKADYLRITIR